MGHKSIPDTALVESESKGGDGETDEPERTRVANLEEAGAVDLRDGGLIRFGEVGPVDL